ncbi:MAG: CPBP family intramembrane metalloprotease [Bacteroidales bacterium]|nr:CPBP family intramembrane metalloprotease [Bacteroidales bacterium]
MRLLNFYNSHPATKLLVSFFFILLGFISFFILSVFLAIPLFKIDLPTALQWLAGNFPMEDIRILRYFQIIQSIGMFVIPPFIIAWMISANSYNYLFLKEKPEWKTVILVILSMIVALPLINFIAELNSKMILPDQLVGLEEKLKQLEQTAQELTDKFLYDLSLGALIANIFMIAIIPAIGEELVFRGIILRIFTEWTKNKHLGIIISALLFSAFHLQFYGFVPRFLLGLYFGYLLFWTGTMWIPVIAHFTNNLSAVLYYYFYGKETLNSHPDDIGTGADTLYYLVMSIIVFTVITYIIYNREKNRKPLNT